MHYYADAFQAAISSTKLQAPEATSEQCSKLSFAFKKAKAMTAANEKKKNEGIMSGKAFAGSLGDFYKAVGLFWASNSARGVSAVCSVTYDTVFCTVRVCWMAHNSSYAMRDVVVGV